jgi:choice-of-anchor C domain-containing protein
LHQLFRVLSRIYEIKEIQIMKRFFFAMAIGAQLLLSGSQTANAESLITNGSFEDASVNPGDSFVTLGSGSTAITGWTVGGNGIDYIGGYWQASDGSRSLDMSGLGAGTIASTSFTTMMSQKYLVSFDMAGNTDGGPIIKSLDVAAPGYTNTFTFDTTGMSHTSMGWKTYSFVFTATGTTSSLSFSSLDNTPYGPALDNVRAEAVVPVPGSLALLLSGLASAGGIGWLKRRKPKTPSV